jgi:hypothetical protein
MANKSKTSNCNNTLSVSKSKSKNRLDNLPSDLLLYVIDFVKDDLKDTQRKMLIGDENKYLNCYSSVVNNIQEKYGVEVLFRSFIMTSVLRFNHKLNLGLNKNNPYPNKSDVVFYTIMEIEQNYEEKPKYLFSCILYSSLTSYFNGKQFFKKVKRHIKNGGSIEDYSYLGTYNIIKRNGVKETNCHFENIKDKNQYYIENIVEPYFNGEYGYDI